MTAEISYDIGESFNGKPEAGEVLLRIPFVRDVEFPIDLEGSEGVVVTAPVVEAVFSIKKNGIEFATMTFAISQTTATFLTVNPSVEETFAPGDVLTVVAPAVQDTFLSDLGLLLKAYKI